MSNQALSLKEIQNNSLGCLKFFDKFCREHNLRYSLAYGTLIGAIRHKGFIPWDDDIDVMMLRKDYNRLVESFLSHNNHERYRFINHINCKNYYYSIARLEDRKTKIVYHDNRDDGTNGCFIDIYPIDNIYDSERARKITNWLAHKRWGWIYNCKKSLCEEGMDKFFYKFFNKQLIFALADSPLLFLTFKSKYVCDLWNMFGIIPVKYQYNHDECFNINNYKLERKWFDEYTDVIFEDGKYMSIAAYDVFLRTIYGDYLELPPEEKRIAHHEYDAYQIE